MMAIVRLASAIFIFSVQGALAGDWVVKPFGAVHRYNPVTKQGGDGFDAFYYNKKTAEFYRCSAYWTGVDQGDLICLKFNSPVAGDSVDFESAWQFYPTQEITEAGDKLSRISVLSFWVAGPKKEDLRMCRNIYSKPDSPCLTPVFKNA